MDGEMLTWIFLVGGIILMILETIIPGGVAFFLGVSGLLVGALRFLGFLADPFTATLTWLLSSVGLTILIRPVVQKYFGGETSFKYADEDFEAMDQIVDVIEPINDEDNTGRIRFQGISWQARTMEGKVPAGSKVKIKYRDNTTWVVEPIDYLPPESPQLKEKNKN